MIAPHCLHCTSNAGQNNQPPTHPCMTERQTVSLHHFLVHVVVSPAPVTSAPWLQPALHAVELAVPQPAKINILLEKNVIKF